MTQGTGVIFLQKEKFDFYAPGLLKIVEFKFVPEIIRDLEVINTDLLENLIKLFIGSSRIAPCDLVIVLSDNACFIKDFPNPQPQAPQPQGQVTQQQVDNSIKQSEEIQSFIDNVPFENVVSKQFPTGSGKKVIAVNKDFFDAIKKAFESSGFKVSMVLPGMVFENNLGAKPAMDIIIANTILQQADYQRDNNLLFEKKSFTPVATVEKEKSEEKDFTVPDVENKNGNGKKSNKRLFLMLGVFILLIILLIIVYINSLNQQF